jgi:hypothetical protein
MILVIRVAIPDPVTTDDIDWGAWQAGVCRGMVEQARRYGTIVGDWTLSLTDGAFEPLLPNRPDARWLQGEFRIEATE